MHGVIKKACESNECMRVALLFRACSVMAHLVADTTRCHLGGGGAVLSTSRAGVPCRLPPGLGTEGSGQSPYPREDKRPYCSYKYHC